MTTKEKASACLAKLQEYDSAVVVNILNPYLSDETLAYIYDQLMEDE